MDQEFLPISDTIIEQLQVALPQVADDLRHGYGRNFRDCRIVTNLSTRETAHRDNHRGETRIRDSKSDVKLTQTFPPMGGWRSAEGQFSASRLRLIFLFPRKKKLRITKRPLRYLSTLIVTTNDIEA